MRAKYYVLLKTYTSFGREYKINPRRCPLCEEFSVYPLKHYKVTTGMCEKCGHVRQIPPLNVLTDPAGDPKDAKLLISIFNTCFKPKPNPPLKFKGDIRSQGIYY